MGTLKRGGGKEKSPSMKKKENTKPRKKKWVSFFSVRLLEAPRGRTSPERGGGKKKALDEAATPRTPQWYEEAKVGPAERPKS